ncbi:esterase/lipase family protein [Sphingomonas abietis]|uniref:Alpha/beta fold hydrolase n=1 Tax=Sphingomonas abietis TaxID=3012344 RepID=A0ABY7NRV9_9SPHN|nr:alpha/beta fold hydrolase [Sphingomonas abietis]WBO24279.1 alpha/beta fold hydrolase [Sphingomonas abietis]
MSLLPHHCESSVSRDNPGTGRKWWKDVISLAAAAFLSACSPVSVHELSLTAAYRQRNVSALSGAQMSNTTHIVLQRQNLLRGWKEKPETALSSLRSAIQTGAIAQEPDGLFALAELSWLRARKTRDPAQFMAAALYAYAYLAPDAPVSERPDAYDPHFRQACDLYMLALTEALGSPANVQSQHWTLPYATLDLVANPADRSWHGQILSDFRPTARMAVKGVSNVYNHPGLGEPLAAVPLMNRGDNSAIQISDHERIPVSLFIEIPHAREQVLSDHVSGRLSLATDEDPALHAANRPHFPPQLDSTTAAAISLSESVDWAAEYRGFFNGQVLGQHHGLALTALEPHQQGRMPVVMVHGTASGPARWADMVNDLLADPYIRQHYEFWLFSYGTGNPIPYSALQLRRSIAAAVKALGGPQADPALGRVTLIGHSQGGLLSKMLVINAQDRLWNGLMPRPIDSLNLTPATRDVLQDELFPTPMPEVRNVVFISTPQHGSYLATLSVSRLLGRLIRFPLTVRETMQQVASNVGATKPDKSSWRMGSLYGMSPASPFIQSLSAIPVAPDVQAHSIIPVLKDGPLDHASDGVVKYESAHIPGVDSELVVRHSAHSTQSNPVTIAEVRRLLVEQAQDLAGDALPSFDMAKRNIIRMGGEYVPTSMRAK